MRIWYITTSDPKLQGDYQENIILIGLRNILGDSVIDLPRKDILYGDFSKSPKKELHGAGFTLYDNPIKDIPRHVKPTCDDILLYGVTDSYGVERVDWLEKIVRPENIWFIDGHDDPNLRKDFNCFKRELFSEKIGIYPTGFGIPREKIRSISLEKKKKLIPKNAPDEELMSEFGNVPKIHFHPKYGKYIFDSEEEYYNDMEESWFGITTKRGGWESLRTYELMACGCLVLFKDYDKKPKTCAPVDAPFLSYSNIDELKEITSKLVVDNKPTPLYMYMLMEQRDWLLRNGTCEARAMEILKIIMENSMK